MRIKRWLLFQMTEHRVLDQVTEMRAISKSLIMSQFKLLITRRY